MNSRYVDADNKKETGPNVFFQMESFIIIAHNYLFRVVCITNKEVSA